MSMPGMGVIIHRLGSGSPKNASDYYGRQITSAELKDDEILIGFNDGIKIKIWDDGQSCCESRYITTDDDVKDLVGQTLVKILVKEGPDIQGEYEVHEQAFLEIQGNQSAITFCTHNEHNGYYGGFGLSVDEV